MITKVIWPAESAEQETTHHGFTDLVYFADRWYCCFRESDSHALGKLGKIRVLKSADGVVWQTLKVWSDNLHDLRDPHFSVPDSNRLMLNFSGRIQRDNQYHETNSFAVFISATGEITSPVPMQCNGYWIWQIRWKDGTGYCWARKIVEGLPYALLKTNDGINWKEVVSETGGNETAHLFLSDGTMLALRRARNSLLGISKAPFHHWQWMPLGYFIGGPNLLQLGSGEILGAFRSAPNAELPRLIIGLLDQQNHSFKEIIAFPPAIDCGYPGLVEHGSEIWLSHYHGDKNSSVISLSKIPSNLFLK